MFDLLGRLEKMYVHELHDACLPVKNGLLASIHARQAGKFKDDTKLSPFDRMKQCRDALAKLDTKGWARSFHQRLFHEDFLVSAQV